MVTVFLGIYMLVRIIFDGKMHGFPVQTYEKQGKYCENMKKSMFS